MNFFISVIEFKRKNDKNEQLIGINEKKVVSKILVTIEKEIFCFKTIQKL